MKRESDLIDVWFDSGAMPYAQIHYPFENKEVFDKRGSILPILLPKVQIKREGGSSRCMPSPRWFSIAWPIKQLFRTGLFWIRTETRCPNDWVTLSIRSVRSKSMVPIRYVGI